MLIILSSRWTLVQNDKNIRWLPLTSVFNCSPPGIIAVWADVDEFRKALSYLLTYDVSQKWFYNFLKGYDDIIKWKHFPCYWTFVRGIHWSLVNSPHKGQSHGALMFSLTNSWMKSWVNNREAGDLRRHCADYDVIVMVSVCKCSVLSKLIGVIFFTLITPHTFCLYSCPDGTQWCKETNYLWPL